MLKKQNNKVSCKVTFLLCILFLFSHYVYAENTQIILGGKEGWSAFDYSNGVTTGTGRYGYDCIELATNSFATDELTDLLIDFENPGSPLSSGAYDILTNNLRISTDAIMEKGAGLSRNIGGLSVLGKPGAFFGTEGLLGSFSIEFWLCPSIAENGEVIIKWESSKNVRGRLIYQLMNCIFDGGHLSWTLSNFFDNYRNEYGNNEINLKGTSNIIPDKWTYHVLTYDCETGILEYIVNGVTEDLLYVTSTGDANGEIEFIVLGTPSELQFCTEYTGKIDDIRIMRRPYTPPEYQSAEYAGTLRRLIYSPTGGRFETKPIKVSTGARLNSLSAVDSIPPQTDVCYFVRSGDNFYNWTDTYPEWKPVENGAILDGVTGLYFQVACNLYPDGDGETTPSVTSIELDFSELPLPLPPFTVKAEAGNGSVLLKWKYSVDDTAGGYYIYYGSRPGEYLGRIAVEGASPIKIGNQTSFKVTGLENGKIYYFAIAAWSALDDRIIGPLSKEVFARPLDRLKK